MSTLQGKVALITGGTSGIGAATAKRFQAEGATVIVTGSSQKSVTAAEKEMLQIEVILSNAGDASAAKTLIDQVQKKHGHLDILFVNAGIGRVAPLTATDESLFDEVINVNLRGPFFLIKYAAPVIRDGGSIILTGSTAGVRGFAGLSVYGASKAALRSLGQSLALEFAPRKIRVNTITPGPIETPIGDKMGLTDEQKAGFAKMFASLPIGRPGAAEEVAAAALYFASDDSRFTTGSELRIDGGQTIG